MTLTRRNLVAALAGVPAAMLADRARSCTGIVQASAQVIEVEIALFQFQPARISINAGDTVRWINRDGIEHSATASATGSDGKPVFDTGLFAKGESREITFTRPGTYEYFCTRHPSMKGTVVVKG